jgi:V8-like Glu-specific endopeptidase
MKTRIFIIFLIVLNYTISAQNIEIEYPFGEPGIEVTRGVFGSDDRKEVKDAYGYQDFVRATAVMISKENIYNEEFYAWSLRDLLKRKFGKDRFSNDVKFLDQPTVGSCTGFLIAPDIMVTAGHCINSMEDANKFVWVFDYTKESDFIDGNRLQFKKENIFEVDYIITSDLDDESNNDYSVLKLKRKSNRKPYRFRTSGNVLNQSAINTIGCPTGLPLKFSTNAVVVDNTPKNWFKSDIDAFPGNSGGPVFDKNGFIEGILVRGAVTYSGGSYTGDYRYESSCDCITTVKFDEVNYTAGCQAHKINAIPFDALKRAIYENLQYAIQNNLSERFDSWKIYKWIFNNEYTFSKGLLEKLAIKHKNGYALKEILAITKESYDDNKARQVLDYAINNNNYDAVKTLLDNGILADAGYSSKYTPLQLTIIENKSRIAELLITNGANVYTKTSNNDNLLHLVAKTGNYTIAKILVAKGVSTKDKNNNKKRPEQIAKSYKNKSLAKYLKNARKGRL